MNNSISVDIKLDTGSQVNLLLFKLFKELNHVKFLKTNIKLEAYKGFKIKPINKRILACSVKKQKNIKLTFLIVDLDVQLLLGLKGYIAFGLVVRKHNMGQIDSLKTNNAVCSSNKLLIKNHKEIFKNITLVYIK